MPNSLINGELAYIPAEVKLVKYGTRNPKEFIINDKPSYLLIVEDSPRHHGKIGVLYKNATWYVNISDAIAKAEV